MNQGTRLKLRKGSIMKHTLKFKFEKDTKHTHRYVESKGGKPPVLRTLYIQKWAVKGPPEWLTVTIEDK